MQKNVFLSVVSRTSLGSMLLVALALCLAPAVHAAPERQVITPPADAGFLFGYDVDTQGELMVVGSSQVDAAYVYELVDGVWQQAARLTSGDDIAGSGFGAAVALDDGVIAVGATSDTAGGFEYAGAVYVFARGATNADWTQVARVTAVSPIADGGFGKTLELDGDRLLVAAATYVDTAAYLYERMANGTWQYAHTFSDADASDLVADALALSGDVAAFGSRGGDAYIYEYGSGGWTLTETLALSENFVNVSLEGNRLAVGSSESLEACCPRSEGKVRILERIGDEWTQTAELLSPDPNPFAIFGWRVHLQDGLLAVAENYETARYFAYAQDENGAWQLFFEDGFGAGREDGLVHLPAISAEAVVVGVTATSMEEARVEAWSTAELLAAAGMNAEDDEPVNDDDGSAGADTGDGSPNPGSDNGDGNSGDGDGSGGDLASPEGGDATSGLEVSMSSQESEMGGGAFGGLLAVMLLMSWMRMQRRFSARDWRKEVGRRSGLLQELHCRDWRKTSAAGAASCKGMWSALE